jgi:hypothetical protein
VIVGVIVLVGVIVAVGVLVGVAVAPGSGVEQAFSAADTAPYAFAIDEVPT